MCIICILYIIIYIYIYINQLYLSYIVCLIRFIHWTEKGVIILDSSHHVAGELQKCPEWCGSLVHSGPPDGVVIVWTDSLKKARWTKININSFDFWDVHLGIGDLDPQRGVSIIGLTQLPWTLRVVWRWTNIISCRTGRFGPVWYPTKHATHSGANIFVSLSKVSLILSTAGEPLIPGLLTPCV